MGNETFYHVRGALENLAFFYDVLTNSGMWFSASTAQYAHDALQATGIHHQRLCETWLEQGRRLFHFTEKAHYTQHMALDCLVCKFNPRFGRMYPDEDYMGRLAYVAKACLRGRGPLRLGDALMLRWRNRMWIRWSRHARDRH